MMILSTCVLCLVAFYVLMFSTFILVFYFVQGGFFILITTDDMEILTVNFLNSFVCAPPHILCRFLMVCKF